MNPFIPGTWQQVPLVGADDLSECECGTPVDEPGDLCEGCLEEQRGCERYHASRDD
jgi:hypothetical protein